MNFERLLLRRIRFWLMVFVVGLVLSGVTAFPLETELRWVVRVTDGWVWMNGSEVSMWLQRVERALVETNAKYPFMAYGTDWLAFAHLVIALVFIGVWREPVRNKWVITFGLMACVAVVPLALIAGGVRGIPVFWRMVDCSFGLLGMGPLWVCWNGVGELERLG